MTLWAVTKSCNERWNHRFFSFSDGLILEKLDSIQGRFLNI